MIACVRFGRRELLAGLLLMVVGTATASGDEPKGKCAWRTGEKIGVGFAELCAAPSAPKGLLEESPADVAPFWMSAAPLTCSRGNKGTADCPVATSILTARSRAKDVLEPRVVALVDGEHTTDGEAFRRRDHCAAHQSEIQVAIRRDELPTPVDIGSSRVLESQRSRNQAVEKV